MNIEELKKQIGREYKMFFDDGNYQGCFYPVYFLHPNAERYKLPNADNSTVYRYGLRCISKHCKRIQREELQEGDIIATEFNNELHVAIYLGDDKVIHLCRGLDLRISRMKIFKNDMYFYRVIK